MNITATISWSLIWGVYSNLICRDSGLMRARWPESGYYEVSPTIWLQAHWGQFVQPGWRFLHVPGGGSGFLDVAGAPLHGGTYVSLVPPDDLSGLTVIIETSADTSCLLRNLSHFSLAFTTRGGLPGPGTTLFVWSSTQDELFAQLAPIVIAADSTFSISVAPDSIVTVSTTAGATHGSFPDSPIPAQLPWPLPYREDFSESTYAYDAMARFFRCVGACAGARQRARSRCLLTHPVAHARAPQRSGGELGSPQRYPHAGLVGAAHRMGAEWRPAHYRRERGVGRLRGLGDGSVRAQACGAAAALAAAAVSAAAAPQAAPRRRRRAQRLRRRLRCGVRLE